MQLAQRTHLARSTATTKYDKNSNNKQHSERGAFDHVSVSTKTFDCRVRVPPQGAACARDTTVTIWCPQETKLRYVSHPVALTYRQSLKLLLNAGGHHQYLDQGNHHWSSGAYR